MRIELFSLRFGVRLASFSKERRNGKVEEDRVRGHRI
jgi:hypothetical protein